MGKSYRDLIVGQGAIGVTMEIDRLTEGFPRIEACGVQAGIDNEEPQTRN